LTYSFQAVKILVRFALDFTDKRLTQHFETVYLTAHCRSQVLFGQGETLLSPHTALLIANTIKSGGEAIKVTFRSLNVTHQFDFTDPSGFQTQGFSLGSDNVDMHAFLLLLRYYDDKWFQRT